MTDKTKYLTYIEDTKKHHSLIEKEAQKAVKKAIAHSHKNSVPITYMEGEEIVTEDAQGNREVIGVIENNRRKVKVGGTARISKK